MMARQQSSVMVITVIVVIAIILITAVTRVAPIPTGAVEGYGGDVLAESAPASPASDSDRPGFEPFTGSSADSVHGASEAVDGQSQSQSLLNDHVNTMALVVIQGWPRASSDANGGEVKPSGQSEEVKVKPAGQSWGGHQGSEAEEDDWSRMTKVSIDGWPKSGVGAMSEQEIERSASGQTEEVKPSSGQTKFKAAGAIWGAGNQGPETENEWSRVARVVIDGWPKSGGIGANAEEVKPPAGQTEGLKPSAGQTEGSESSSGQTEEVKPYGQTEKKVDVDPAPAGQKDEVKPFPGQTKGFKPFPGQTEEVKPYGQIGKKVNGDPAGQTEKAKVKDREKWSTVLEDWGRKLSMFDGWLRIVGAYGKVIKRGHTEGQIMGDNQGRSAGSGLDTNEDGHGGMEMGPLDGEHVDVSSHNLKISFDQNSAVDPFDQNSAVDHLHAARFIDEDHAAAPGSESLHHGDINGFEQSLSQRPDTWKSITEEEDVKQQRTSLDGGELTTGRRTVSQRHDQASRMKNDRGSNPDKDGGQSGSRVDAAPKSKNIARKLDQGSNPDDDNNVAQSRRDDHAPELERRRKMDRKNVVMEHFDHGSNSDRDRENVMHVDFALRIRSWRTDRGSNPHHDDGGHGVIAGEGLMSIRQLQEGSRSDDITTHGKETMEARSAVLTHGGQEVVASSSREEVFLWKKLEERLQGESETAEEEKQKRRGESVDWESGKATQQRSFNPQEEIWGHGEEGEREGEREGDVRTDMKLEKAAKETIWQMKERLDRGVERGVEMAGGGRQKVGEAVSGAKEKVGEVVCRAREKMGVVVCGAEEKVGEVISGTKEKVGEVVSGAKETVYGMKEKAGEVVYGAKEKVGEVVVGAKEKVGEAVVGAKEALLEGASLVQRRVQESEERVFHPQSGAERAERIKARERFKGLDGSERDGERESVYRTKDFSLGGVSSPFSREPKEGSLTGLMTEEAGGGGGEKVTMTLAAREQEGRFASWWRLTKDWGGRTASKIYRVAEWVGGAIYEALTMLLAMMVVMFDTIVIAVVYLKGVVEGVICKCTPVASYLMDFAKGLWRKCTLVANIIKMQFSPIAKRLSSIVAKMLSPVVDALRPILAQFAYYPARTIYQLLKPVKENQVVIGIVKTVHLLAFVCGFGTSFWVSYVGGRILMENLPLHEFRCIQSVIYPTYLQLLAFASAGCAAGMSFFQPPWNASSRWDIFEFTVLSLSWALTLVNEYYLEPEASKLMFARMKRERGGRVMNGSGSAVRTSVTTLAQERSLRRRAVRNPSIRRIHSVDVPSTDIDHTETESLRIMSTVRGIAECSREGQVHREGEVGRDGDAQREGEVRSEERDGRPVGEREVPSGEEAADLGQPDDDAADRLDDLNRRFKHYHKWSTILQRLSFFCLLQHGVYLALRLDL
ncbi:hypothetical protein CBR_g3237 [Chara braunii]|uniref:TMEM205-like domain-containing protein n=1 Tax=Chara braunii TaxID=69332 RepID=A0A388KF56_CHABU|nr:hypothetical protein CBR_g3237 [Chara braunii]|eukprot:GBG68695.1 hypothetical protein CBR_g3237 [Chara braunii]